MVKQEKTRDTEALGWNKTEDGEASPWKVILKYCEQFV